ncbi:MAG: UDP-glucose/GDP-mannose dehydrogenase family protein [Candidatus Brocadiia bacterium]
MRLAIVGCGYVGLVTAACFAESGNDVICVDIDQAKLARLEKGEVPFFEPGLGEMVLRNFQEQRLVFSSDIEHAVRESAVIFIAVGTPPGPNGKADLGAVFSVARGIACAMNGHKVIVTKSTVPVGTTDQVSKLIAENTSHPFDVVNNPEFLKEGSALDDFLKPDRVVVGVHSESAGKLMADLYSPFLRTGSPIMILDVRSSEMTKYVSNAMLATRISMMNEMANICERVGADVQKVRLAVGADKRIGSAFLFPGLGFGGSCFPKDLDALCHTAAEYGYEAVISTAVNEVNARQKAILIPRILKHFGGRIEGKTFAIWGLAFKPRTDDMREAPSLVIIEKLLELGAHIQAYDPEAQVTARNVLGNRVQLCEKNYDALDGADGLIIVTEWNAFRNPDFNRMKLLMKSPVIFDGRDIYEPERVRAEGFTYYCIGRPDGK